MFVAASIAEPCIPADNDANHRHPYAFLPESWPDLAARYRLAELAVDQTHRAGKADIMRRRQVLSRTSTPRVGILNFACKRWIADSIDLQVISATPVLFAYERPAANALDCAKLFNDAALELCSRGKGRMKALCQVPLQDIDACLCRTLTRHEGRTHRRADRQSRRREESRRRRHHHLSSPLREGRRSRSRSSVGHDGARRMPNYMLPWTVAMPAETQLRSCR